MVWIFLLGLFCLFAFLGRFFVWVFFSVVNLFVLKGGFIKSNCYLDWSETRFSEKNQESVASVEISFSKNIYWCLEVVGSCWSFGFCREEIQVQCFCECLYCTVLLRGLKQRHISVGNDENSWKFLHHKVMHCCTLCWEIIKAGRQGAVGRMLLILSILLWLVNLTFLSLTL